MMVIRISRLRRLSSLDLLRFRGEENMEWRSWEELYILIFRRSWVDDI